MKEKIKTLLEFLFDIRNFLFGLFLFILDGFAIHSLSTSLSNFSEPFNMNRLYLMLLFSAPWIIFAISSQIDNNKYHLLWHNRKNVELILKTLDVYETYNPNAILEKYSNFLSFEKKDHSLVAKYFLSEKEKSDKENYEIAVRKYNLSLFIKLTILLSLCHECITNYTNNYTEYFLDELCRFSEYVYGKEVTKCRYKLIYDNSGIDSSDAKEIFAYYITFSVYDKRRRISFEDMILFAIDYFDYHKDYKTKQKFELYYQNNIASTEFKKYYNTGDFENFVKNLYR